MEEEPAEEGARVFGAVWYELGGAAATKEAELGRESSVAVSKASKEDKDSVGGGSDATFREIDVI